MLIPIFSEIIFRLQNMKNLKYYRRVQAFSVLIYTRTIKRIVRKIYYADTYLPLIKFLSNMHNIIYAFMQLKI